MNVGIAIKRGLSSAFVALLVAASSLSGAQTKIDLPTQAKGILPSTLGGTGASTQAGAYSNIVAPTLTVNSDATKGSAGVGFLPQGTGATGTTVQQALRDAPLNVKTFGIACDGTTDDTAKWVQAVATGKDLYWPPCQSYVTDKITLQNGQRLFGAGRNKSQFIINAGFNMAATSVLQLGTGEPGAEAYDIGFVFTQVDQAVRASVTHYPPAIDGSNIPRFIIDRIRIESAWDGIKATGNCGGAYIGFIEVAALNKGVQLDGALDFVHGTKWHFWNFGALASTTNLINVYLDGTTIAAEIGRVDGLDIGTISTYGTKVVLTSTLNTSPPNYIGLIQLDGDGARLTQAGGVVSIGSVYDTKSSAPTASSIVSSGGDMTIGMLQSSDSHNGKVIEGTGGTINVLGGRMVFVGVNSSAVAAASGAISLLNVEMAPSALAYTQPHVAISGSAVLRMHGVSWVGKGAGSGTALSITNDSFYHYISGNTFAEWTYTTPASPAYGVYGPNAGSFAGAFGTVGAHALTLTTTADSNVTLPTTGTLATLAGAETLSGKVYNGTSSTLNTGTATTALTVITAGANTSVSVTDTGSSGANFKLTGDGGITPDKTIRARAGNLEYVSAGYSSVIGQMADNGFLGVAGGASTTTALSLPAGTTGYSSLRMPHGAAPTSPTNGDSWTTSGGFFARINGTTASFAGSNTGDQTITLTNDVTGTGTGSFAATIANAAVTYAKMQNVSATSRFLGRITAGAGSPEELTAANAKTILALTPSDVGLGSVTNDAQTKAAIVPNTAPSTGQLLIGNAGGTAYAPITLSGPVSVTSAGVTAVSTLNQNTTGSAGALSVSGQTALMTVAGLTSTNRIKTFRDAADTVLELGGSYSPSGTWTSMALAAPAISGGLTASGSASNNFSGSSGAFQTSSGVNTLNGAVTVNDATTPSITTAAGKTNTGFLQVNGKTSGALKLTAADAAAQTVTVNLVAQTTGASTVNIPDMAGASDTIGLLAKSQAFTNKTYSGTSATISSGSSTPAATFTSSGTGGAGTIVLTDTGSGGASIKFVGDGVTTPDKWIRITGGNMEWVSSGYAAVIAQMTNSGFMGFGGGASPSTALNLPAGTTGNSSLRIAHGVAPSSPVNGDEWTTTSGPFMQINGSTRQLATLDGSEAITNKTSLLSSGTGGVGYSTGAGGTVTQITTKATGVTLSKLTGQITMNNAALAGSAKVFFTVTNTLVAATDVPVCVVASGGTANAYRAWVSAVAAGSYAVGVENVTAGSLSEAPVLNCSVIKGVSS